ncbi:MAG TPA: VOC family protein [Usitatibacter sp.]|nr:VOC family protein [Usitatibacter sp.]
MAIQGMNHFNVLTDDVDATRMFYIGVLGMSEGSRPPLAFDGAWLYAGGAPILHVSAAKLPADRAGVLDHIAFSATDLQATIARLREHQVQFNLRRQVGTGIWQIFCHDPMGAKVELDFDPSESAP